MTITIANLRHTKKGIKCDRTSPLGNPFWLRDEKDRDDVCTYHYAYFELVVDKHEPAEAIAMVMQQYPEARLVLNWKVPLRSEFMAALDAIQDGDTILCWCSPKRCHLNTVKQFLERKFVLPC